MPHAARFMAAIKEVDWSREASNDVTLIGNVREDPQIGETRSGTKVLNFDIAVHRGKEKSPIWCASGLQTVLCPAVG
jgi:hypothetical protein